MAFRYRGIECDTAKEALELAGYDSGDSSVAVPPASTPRKKKRAGRPNLAVKKRWVKVRALAKKEGISIREASAKLKKA